MDLDGREAAGEAPTKQCPGCGATVPLATVECPLCGHAWIADDGDEGGGAAPLEGFVMTEIDLLKRSSFDSVDLFGTDDALMAAGFTAWGGVFGWQGVWYAVGGRRGAASRLLAIGERMVCLAAADARGRHEAPCLVEADRTRRGRRPGHALPPARRDCPEGRRRAIARVL